MLKAWIRRTVLRCETTKKHTHTYTHTYRHTKADCCRWWDLFHSKTRTLVTNEEEFREKEKRKDPDGEIIRSGGNKHAGVGKPSCTELQGIGKHKDMRKIVFNRQPQAITAFEVRYLVTHVLLKQKLPIFPETRISKYHLISHLNP